MAAISIRFMVLILIVFHALACNNAKHNNTSHKTQDTIILAYPDSSRLITLNSDTTFPSLFEGAFNKDAVIKEKGSTYSFKTLGIGKIQIVSGKIIACDPVTMKDGVPFVHNFPKGNFPVQLAIIKINASEYVAYSRIVFSNRPVAKWTTALQPGQKEISISDTNFYCYGVDAGTGIFIDSVANRKFNAKDFTVWQKVFINGMTKANYTGLTYNFDQYNLAAFSTGYGDGCYATYIGLDKSGNICRLLTDFSIIDWWNKR